MSAATNRYGDSDRVDPRRKLRRSRARQARRALLLAVWLVIQMPSSAAVIPVTASCELAEAIDNANDDAATHADCPAGAGADRITLDADVALTTVADTSDGPNGLPSITSDVTIAGNGHKIARSGATAFRIFHVAAAGRLTLIDTTVENGLAEAVSATARGGGIMSRGELAVIHSAISNNTASASGLDVSAKGGGIYSYVNTVVRLANSTVADNTAIVDGTGSSASGGGIDSYGRLIVRNSTLSGNVAEAIGVSAYASAGAIDSAIGAVTLENSTVSGNSAEAQDAYGGAIYHGGGGALELVNVTVSGNTALAGDTASAGGIHLGGGAAMTLTNSTVFGNSATGAFSYGGNLYPASGTITAAGSIVAAGTPDDCYETIVDAGHSFDSDGTCGADFDPLVPGTDVSPTLLDNGGPVETHALAPGSAALDRAACGLLVDGRETERDALCDSGAFELGTDDRFESSGSGGTDDLCPGHHVLFDKAERHLHSFDEDWVWFVAQAGATYEITTSNLSGAPGFTDTTLTLFSNACSTQEAFDDNSGGGSASQIVFTSPMLDELAVKVAQVSTYSTGRRYDVTVRCTSGCPVCDLPGGDSFDLVDERIVSYRRVEACSAIAAEGATRVLARGEAELRSGEAVALGNGFEVHADGVLTVAIDPNLSAP